MAKVIIEFDQDSERIELLRAVKANRLALTIWDFTEHLRKEYKYNNDVNQCCTEALERTRAALRDIIEDNEVTDCIE